MQATCPIRHNRLQRSCPTGERLAEEYLNKNGFETRFRSYRAAGGEIDLIVETDTSVIFVEVKTATSQHFGQPENQVTKAKQAQIIKVARGYLQKHPTQLQPRFDVVGVDLTLRDPQIRHYENAFTAPA